MLTTFHYALNPDGCLLLGASETVGEFTDLFQLKDRKHKIYVRTAAPARLPTEFKPPVGLEIPPDAHSGSPLPPVAVEEFDLKKEADRMVLETHAPAGVVVDDNMIIIQFRGHTGPFLEPAPGRASLNLIDMARQNLKVELRRAIFQAKKTKAPVSKQGVRIKQMGSELGVSIEVTPMTAPDRTVYYLVLFDSAPVPSGRGAAAIKGAATDPTVEQEREKALLRKDLADTREYMQAMIEERDSASEELRAANEEVQSSNEELQSINEELETAKEELQSSNEELTTLNDELQNRNTELMRLNDALELTQRETEDARRYAQSIVETIRESLLVLDRDLRVVSANASFYDSFKMARLETEDKLIFEIGGGQWDIPSLRKLLVSVVTKNTGFQDFQVDHHFAHIGRRTFILNARLILRGAEAEKLVLLAIEDITLRHRAEDALKFSEERYRAIADTATDAVVSVDTDSKIVFWNPAAEALFGYTRRQALGQDVDIIVPARYRRKHRRGVARFLSKGESRIIGNAIELAGLRKDGTEVPIELSVANWKTSEGVFFTGIARDITERKQAEQRRRRRKEFSDALNKISYSIGESLDVDDILHTVVLEANKVICSESAIVILRENDRWVIKQAHGFPEKIVGKILSDDQTQPFLLAAKTGEPVAISDARSDKRLTFGDLKKSAPRSLLAVPLVVHNRVIGAMSFNCHSAATVFSEDAIEFTKKMAILAALAVENARLYTREHNIAETLQEALLVMPEEIEGLEFGCRYESATAEPARVGGDFYDLFELGEDKVGIIVGDVSGKGLEAAKLTALVKNTIKAHAYHDASPASIMSKANSLVCRLTEYTFVTIFFGVLDKRTGEVVYCCAGHPPPIIRRASFRTARLLANSPAIGLFVDLPFADDKGTLLPGDMLIGYTDGVTDARHGRRFFGENRLIRLIKDKKAVDASNMPATILQEVRAFANGKLTDDVALLAVSLKPEK